MKNFLNILTLIVIIALGLVGGTILCHYIVAFFNWMGANMITMKDMFGVWIVSVFCTYGIMALIYIVFTSLFNSKKSST